jgi:hypothetical protein
MSSPVHHPDDLDAALRYAPPWARKTDTPSAASPGDPAMQSPPTSPSDDEGEPPFDGDRDMLALRHRLSLDPDHMPEPPVRIDDRPTLDRIALRLCAVAGVAALVAWVTISLPTLTISLPIKPHADKIAHAAALPPLTATPVKVVRISAAVAPLPIVPATPLAPVIVPVRVADATPQTARTPPEAAPAADPPQPAAKIVTLAPDEIAMLVKRGNDLLMNGDISSARLLLRRAAEAGNAEAALALGSTFDSAVIARLGAVGVEADSAEARKWYEKAVALGSNVALEQLANLAEAGR